MMDFSEALDALKEGKKIRRVGWNGKGQYVQLAYMDTCIMSDGTAISEPVPANFGSRFLMFVGTSGYQCGWLASQADLLAEDWEIVDGSIN